MQMQMQQPVIPSLNDKPRILDIARKMLANQAALNFKSYSEEWMEKGKSLVFDYSLAASQEISEFNDSFGYSWWSKSPQDLSNCRTEIVDAVHFMLSQSIIEADVNARIEEAAHTLMGCYYRSFNIRGYTTLGISKMLQASLCTVGSFNILETEELKENPWVFLFALARSINFEIDHLYTRYIGKSLLNAFRQEQGYKTGVYKFGMPREGKYLKVWDGLREDNYILSEWLDGAENPPSENDIKVWLSTNYAEFVALSEVARSARYETSKDAV